MGARSRGLESHPLLPFDNTHRTLRWLHDQLAPDPFDRTIVVTTSEQAASALCRGLLRQRPGLLGAHFVSATGMARTLLQLTRSRHPQRSPDPLMEREILRGCLSDHPGELSRYASRYPGALLRLLASVKELEQAGWPEPGSRLSSWGRDVRAIGATYRQRMSGMATRGRLMELALEAAANPAVDDLPARILLVGYPHPERDLVLLLDQLRRRPGVEVMSSPETGDRHPPVSLHSTPDITEELRLAARLCLEACRDGIRMNDMVVAAPSLGPYAAFLRRAFAAEGVPFTAKAEGSLLYEPRAAFHQHVAGLLSESGRRASFIAVASSPLLRDRPGHVELEVFERLSREQSLGGSAAAIDEFLETLRVALSRSNADGDPLIRLLLDLRDVARESCSTVADEVRRLREFCERALAPAEQPRDARAERRIAECLDALAQADPDTGSGRGGDFVGHLRDLFAHRGLPIREGRGPGVAVVEHRDALSFPAAHLHLLGLSAEQVPGANAAELLDPKDREELAGLVSQTDIRDREREVLQLALRHPARSLVLSYPRSTGLGRVGGPSPWLDPLLAELPSPISENREPAHPQARARSRIDTGLCPPDLALADLALHRARMRELREVVPVDVSTLRRARRLERFQSTDLQWDGDVGTDLGKNRAAAGLRVGDIEHIGKCPQQFLFRRLMKLEPLPREMDPLDLRRDLLGSLVHRVLQDVQEAFAAEMTTSPGGDLAPRMSARAKELLQEGWKREATTIGPGLPSLRTLLQERWATALSRAIEADLELLASEHRRPDAIEADLRATLTLSRPGGAPVELDLMGRADRIDSAPDNSRAILDFKTGSRPDETVDPKRILHGWHLQLVLYGMMLRETQGDRLSSLEIRTVNPVALQERGACLNVPASLIDEPEGVTETVAVLGELLMRGALVPNVRNGPCAFCDFRLACRRLHPPSAERVLGSAVDEVQRYFALAGKTASRPLLDREDSP